MDRKAQLTIGFIVKLIIGIAVLAIVLVFVTGKFRQGGEAIGAASPQERDLAINTCQSACSRAGLAAASATVGACGKWQNTYCNAIVNLEGQQKSCHENDDDGFRINCEEPTDCDADPCIGYPSPYSKELDLVSDESSGG